MSEDWPHAKQRAVYDVPNIPQTLRADTNQFTHPEPFTHFGKRRWRSTEKGRDHGNGDENGSENKQVGLPWISRLEEQLSPAHSKKTDHHVKGKNPATILIADSFIELSFGDHEYARIAQPVGKTHYSPDQGSKEHGVYENRYGSNGNQCGKDSDINHPVYCMGCPD